MDHEAHTPFCSEDVKWDERPLLQMQQRLPSDPTPQSPGFLLLREQQPQLHRAQAAKPNSQPCWRITPGTSEMTGATLTSSP